MVGIILTGVARVVGMRAVVGAHSRVVALVERLGTVLVHPLVVVGLGGWVVHVLVIPLGVVVALGIGKDRLLDMPIVKFLQLGTSI